MPALSNGDVRGLATLCTATLTPFSWKRNISNRSRPSWRPCGQLGRKLPCNVDNRKARRMVMRGR